MTIYVSDLGITKNNPYSNTSSKVNYVSINERMNQSPVEKVKGVDSVEDSKGRRSVIRDEEQKYVAATTPAYTVEFTSAGKVALQSMQKMNANNESVTAAADIPDAKELIEKADNNKSDIQAKSVQSSDDKDDLNDSVKIEKKADIRSEERTQTFNTLYEDTEVSKAEPVMKNTNLFDNIREQLLGDVSDDEKQVIEEKAADDAEKLEKAGNPEQDSTTRGLDSTQSAVMKQAVSAYNFQMNFQINAMGIQ